MGGAGVPTEISLWTLLIHRSFVYTFCIFKIVCDREAKQNFIPLLLVLEKFQQQLCWLETWH